MPYTAYIASVTYIEKNPAIIQGFTNAIYRGLIWTDTHSAAEIAKAIPPDFTNVPVTTIQTVINEYKKIRIWATEPAAPP